MVDNNFIKFKWENDKEFNYRNQIYNISKIGADIMNKISKAKEHKNNKLYIESKDGYTKLLNQLFALDVPIVYSLTYNYLELAYEYYIKAMDILIDEYVQIESFNFNKINKAATFIKVGNSYITIISCKNFELFELQQAAYNENVVLAKKN